MSLSVHPPRCQYAAPIQRQAPTAQFLLALAKGEKPTARDMQDLAYALHSVCADMPQIEWMTTSFEEVGDSMGKAVQYMAWAGVDE